MILQGNFTADNSVQLFSISVAAPSAADIRGYGYAGATASTGTVVPRGGFDTIPTLFSSSGVFINDNDDGPGVLWISHRSGERYANYGQPRCRQLHPAIWPIDSSRSATLTSRPIPVLRTVAHVPAAYFGTSRAQTDAAALGSGPWAVKSMKD